MSQNISINSMAFRTLSLSTQKIATSSSFDKIRTSVDCNLNPRMKLLGIILKQYGFRKKKLKAKVDSPVALKNKAECVPLHPCVKQDWSHSFCTPCAHHRTKQSLNLHGFIWKKVFHATRGQRPFLDRLVTIATLRAIASRHSKILLVTCMFVTILRSLIAHV